MGWWCSRTGLKEQFNEILTTDYFIISFHYFISSLIPNYVIHTYFRQVIHQLGRQYCYTLLLNFEIMKKAKTIDLLYNMYEYPNWDTDVIFSFLQVRSRNKIPPFYRIVPSGLINLHRLECSSLGTWRTRAVGSWTCWAATASTSTWQGTAQSASSRYTASINFCNFNGPILLATATKLGKRQERGTRDKPSQFSSIRYQGTAYLGMPR